MVWIRHNQGLAAAIVVVLILITWLTGCASKVQSILTDRNVTRPELIGEINSEGRRLEVELANLQELARARLEELDDKDLIKQRIFEFMALTAQTGGVNISGVVALVGGIIGVGAVIDNRIKDKVIANRPLNNGTVVT